MGGPRHDDVTTDRVIRKRNRCLGSLALRTDCTALPPHTMPLHDMNDRGNLSVTRDVFHSVRLMYTAGVSNYNPWMPSTETRDERD